MKQLMLVFTVGVVMFAASAGASWYLRGIETNKAAETGHADDKGHGSERASPLPGAGVKSAGKASGALDAPPAPSQRTPVATEDGVAQMVASVRRQQESLRAREQNLLVRQKHLEVIHQDLKSERKSLDELRQQVNDEMKALAEKLDALERKSSDLDRKKNEMGKQAQEVKQTVFEVESVEQKNFKRMATTFDSMDADTAGELLEQMVESGKMDTAVKILSLMQERQAARVLGQMQDRGTAIQLLERMKGLKRAPATP